jgi:hypothetical protein
MHQLTCVDTGCSMAMLTAYGHLKSVRVAEKCDGTKGTEKFVNIKVRDLMQVVKNGHLPVYTLQEVLYKVYTSCGNLEQDAFATTFLNLEKFSTPDGIKCCEYDIKLIYLHYFMFTIKYRYLFITQVVRSRVCIHGHAPSLSRIAPDQPPLHKIGWLFVLINSCSGYCIFCATKSI